MALLAPQLTLEQTVALVAILVHRANGRWWVLRRLLQICFNTTLDSPTAIELYRFTIDQLALLTAKLRLPDPVVTPAGDNVRGLESLTMLCRRFAEPSKLHTIANEFGRSQAAVSRIVLCVARMIYTFHADLLYMNDGLVRSRMERYCQAVKTKGAPPPKLLGAH
ncbi:hypothetical protein H257_11371 [Aphanomyces astaci]|uniref:Nuclease HARBI1 n=1 Tax=Aphanomyces astaci TaxID=112090 RepID=W4G570_APHAT|nr:hypothetical protein H257_11371 [Aphanomyces astaci]ETV74058.1 hypothetical protein H257_11371 [Aphanomyces astaci]|eukprot:XP_009836571.1 hypothetical protein H257_11371 [Aphanomyces astaci]